MTKFFLSKMLASWTLLAVCLQAFGQDSLRVPSDRIRSFDTQVQRLVEQSIAEKKMPGCIVAVGDRDGVCSTKRPSAIALSIQWHP